MLASSSLFWRRVFTSDAFCFLAFLEIYIGVYCFPSYIFECCMPSTFERGAALSVEVLISQNSQLEIFPAGGRLVWSFCSLEISFHLSPKSAAVLDAFARSLCLSTSLRLRLLFLFTPVSPSRLGFFLSTLILRHGEFGLLHKVCSREWDLKEASTH